MRVLLFDWHEDGHHPVYLERVATALGPHADVVVAAPASVGARLAGRVDGELVDLGPSRQELSSGASRVRLDKRELDLLDDCARGAGASHAVHLFADHLLPMLSLRGPFAVPLSVLLLRPRRHYTGFSGALTGRERLSGSIYELLLARFRRRRDAHAVFTLDPVAAEGWNLRPGAPALWLPEPWVEVHPPATASRAGCALYGYLSHRKGVDRLARAIERLEPGMRVVIAGEAEPGYEDELSQLCAAMSAAGARVERVGSIGEAQAQEILATAQVVLLPYRRHIGMSRVLIEAAVAGTPVLADEFGLLGHLTAEWELGEVTDTADPDAFAAALKELAEGTPDSEGLRRRADQLTGRAALEGVLAEVFGGEGRILPAS